MEIRAISEALISVALTKGCSGAQKKRSGTVSVDWSYQEKTSSWLMLKKVGFIKADVVLEDYIKEKHGQSHLNPLRSLRIHC